MPPAVIRLLLLEVLITCLPPSRSEDFPIFCLSSSFFWLFTLYIYPYRFEDADAGALVKPPAIPKEVVRSILAVIWHEKQLGSHRICFITVPTLRVGAEPASSRCDICPFGARDRVPTR